MTRFSKNLERHVTWASLATPMVILNLFAEGSQIQTYGFVREPLKKF